MKKKKPHTHRRHAQKVSNVLLSVLRTEIQNGVTALKNLTMAPKRRVRWVGIKETQT